MRIILADIARYEDCIAKAAMRLQATQPDFQAKRIELQRAGSDAIIPVTGPLVYREDFWSWMMDATDYESIRIRLEMAAMDPEVSRVILVFDTPGGEVTGLTEIASLLGSYGKPTVAVVDPLCASAGLWIASQCDSIVSVPSGEIGSLGVQAVHASYYEMFKKTGLDIKVFRASISPEKNLGHPYEDRSESADKYMQARVDKWGMRFVETVASGRGVTTEEVLSKFGKGQMLDSDDAKAVGLIDEIGSLRSVLAGSKGRYPSKRRAISRRTLLN